MRLSGLGSLCLAAAVCLPAAAQRTGFDQALPPQVELPPRYRIEFILFAHNRFDPAEEHFDIVPPTSRFAASDAPIPQRVFDEETRAALLELIEGPISPPPEPELGAGEIPDGEPALEAYFDPALVEGPATRFLEPEELTLMPTLARLERLDGYRPLLHGGWEQNGLAEADAVPIELAEFMSGNPRGTMRLHMSRYLHIALDIAYRDETPARMNAGAARGFGDTPGSPQQGFGPGNDNAFRVPAAPEFYLFEQRRILRGELNYFDHPAFGLLLKITLAPEPGSEANQALGRPSA